MLLSKLRFHAAWTFHDFASFLFWHRREEDIVHIKPEVFLNLCLGRWKKDQKFEQGLWSLSQRFLLSTDASYVC